MSRQVENPPATEPDAARRTDEVASLTRERVGDLILQQALAEFARRRGDILPTAEADAPTRPDILPTQEPDAPRRRGRRRARPDSATRPEAPKNPESPASPESRLPRKPKVRLGEYLVQRALVLPHQVDDALALQKESGGRLGSVLVDLGAVRERDMVGVLAEQIGVPAADLRHESPDPDVISLLDEGVARELKAIPLRRDDDSVTIAVADPQSDDVRKGIETAVRERVRYVIAPTSDIEQAINNCYRALDGVSLLIQTFKATDTSQATPAAAADADASGDDAPVVRLVSLLITQALRDRASDVHIEPHFDDVRVRFRIDGALQDVLAMPASMGPSVVSRLKIMAGMNIVERRKPQDGQITTEVEGRGIDIRVSTAPTIAGEKAVLRVLERKRSLLRLGALGMPTETHERYSGLVRTPYGMVICAGPTGSGKTTTLYATLAELNDSQANITTLEDPVEYVFQSINQIQVNEQAGITFADGLRSILRQDPDMILVGEIRDVETARLAVQSALTGHFVMSSIHATDAVSALQRFVDMGIERFLIASSVTAIVSQRLVRRICTQCRAKYQPSVEELAFFESVGKDPKDTFWHGEGCNFCAGTGYQDRIGVYELLAVSDELRHGLLTDVPHAELRAVAVAQGMRPLVEEGVRLVYEDMTTLAEIMRNIYTQ